MEEKKRSPSEEDNDEEGRRSSRRKKAKVRPEYPQLVKIFVLTKFVDVFLLQASFPCTFYRLNIFISFCKYIPALKMLLYDCVPP